MQSAATAQSTMDFSTMAVDDGVVNSPVASCQVRQLDQSPSPVRSLLVGHNVKPIENRCGRINRVLYDGEADATHDLSPKVSFLHPAEAFFPIWL